MRWALGVVPLALLVVVAVGAPRLLTPKPALRPVVLTVRSGRVPSGDEIQRCHRLRLPRGTPTEIGRVRMFVRGGSHHVHLYRPYNGAPVYPPLECPFAVDFDHWQLIAATQKPLLDWILPPGVAIPFDAREPVMVQTHFVNGGALSTRGRSRARIELEPVDPSTVRAHAGAIFAQDRALLVPPGRSTVKSRCTLTGEGAEAREMNILAFTGHYHFRGVEFEVYRVRVDGTLGERLYHHTGYDDPEFTQYKGPAALVLRPGEGIEWWCTYQNDGDQTYEFGPNTQRNEHCNLFGFYYPTALPREAIDCIHTRDEAGVEHTRRIVAQ